MSSMPKVNPRILALWTTWRIYMNASARQQPAKQLMQLLVEAVNNKVDANHGSGGHARLNLKQSNFFACGFDVSSSYICTDEEP